MRNYKKRTFIQINLSSLSENMLIRYVLEIIIVDALRK